MLNSLYEKAIAKRGFIKDIASDTDIDSQLEFKWFNRTIDESKGEFSIAAGDGSFNKKKFLTTNFCAVGAESIIYDGEIKKIDDSDIFDISVVEFLDIIKYEVGDEISLKYKIGEKSNSVTELVTNTDSSEATP